MGEWMRGSNGSVVVCEKVSKRMVEMRKSVAMKMDEI